MQELNFPPRFKMEGLNPFELKVEVVARGLYLVYDNLAAAEAAGINFNGLCGPMAGKIDGQWCVRFETQDVYKHLSV